MRELVFSRKISLKPDRVVLFNEVLRKRNDTGELVALQFREKTLFTSTADETKKPVVKRDFHNFRVSPAGQKKIREKITWLYTLAKSRYVKSVTGKEILNFKICFLTLTLPSKQMHPTSQITQECFNQFVTELRAKLGIENYVWRLEFQKNGNVHYHLVSDIYIDYYVAQKIWNRIINKLGYVDAFTKKFSDMTLNEYVLNQSYTNNNDFKVLAMRYAKGKQNGWKIPRSVDVVSCSSGKQISYYISKYFSKEKDNNCHSNQLDNEDNSFGLRLWFCSRSLSKLTSICDYAENVSIDWFSLLHKAEKVREVVLDYAHCLFFSISEMTNYAKSLLYPAFHAHAHSLGYRVPT